MQQPEVPGENMQNLSSDSATPPNKGEDDGPSYEIELTTA